MSNLEESSNFIESESVASSAPHSLPFDAEDLASKILFYSFDPESGEAQPISLGRRQRSYEPDFS